MGVLLSPQACSNQKMMKSVTVVALCMFAAAVAEPEASADAGYHYGYAGYPHHYGYAHHGYYVYGPYAYGHHYGKRSADAEPTAVRMLMLDTTTATPDTPTTTAMPTTATTATPMPTATTTARGLLMLSPLLWLMLVTSTADTDTDTPVPTATAMLTTATMATPMLMPVIIINLLSIVKEL